MNEPVTWAEMLLADVGIPFAACALLCVPIVVRWLARTVRERRAADRILRGDDDNAPRH